MNVGGGDSVGSIFRSGMWELLEARKIAGNNEAARRGRAMVKLGLGRSCRVELKWALVQLGYVGDC